MNLPLLPVLAAATAAADTPPAWVQFLPMVAIVVVMWLLFLRPQMKQQKEQRAKLEAIKKGDQVLTGGGLIGKVTKVDDTYVEVELAANVRVRALKSTITDVIPPGGAPAAND
ncbi:MAG: preprotein translocase subunit YajC [Sphingomonadales bacterium]|nr:preprotein translocase subunit YajC [Sphingomonadales bacterium]